MQRLRITHLTEYQFGSPVTLLPHRLLLRPREGHDVHIETSKLEIAPPHTVKWHRDVFDNSVAVVSFLEPAARLTIASEVVIQHYEEAPLDFLVEDYAVSHLGLASRFVSGYSHGSATEAGNASTHAWIEVYLPGPGWKGFDPTSGELTGNRHIPVAVARHPQTLPPVAGSFVGPAGLRPALIVNVQVTAL